MSDHTKMIIDASLIAQRNEAQIVTYRQMIRDGRATCPSANGKDLELWEMARAAELEYQPKTGQKCTCRPGQQRDNCPTCEGTGMVIDFAAIRARGTA